MIYDITMSKTQFSQLDTLNRITNHLIMSSNSIQDIGLYYGKLGIIAFFYHYSRFVQKTIYEKFADELLDEVCETVHEQLPCDLANGYCGIGWTVEYLFKQKFIKGNTYEILRNIDEKVMERDTRRITDKSLASGIEGIFLYVLVRLTTHPLDILFDINYLNELYDIAKIIQKEDEEEHVFLNNYIKWFEGKIIESDIFSLRSCLNLSDTLLYKGNIWNCGIGLKDGCAGIGMKLMMEI